MGHLKSASTYRKKLILKTCIEAQNNKRLKHRKKCYTIPHGIQKESAWLLHRPIVQLKVS
jgi:hypothetical protein